MFGPFWWTLVSINRRSWYANARRWYRNWLLILLMLVLIFSRDHFLLMSVFLEAIFEAPWLANYSRDFVDVFLIQHFGLLLVITPAMAAGAITEEKARGTLEYLLTTPLRPLEIILAKWLAQTILVADLALIGLPLFCLFGIFAGLELTAILGVTAATVLLLFALSALSLLASVWCRKTSTAVFTAYTMGGVTAAVLAYLGWADFFLAPFALAGLDPDGPGLLERLHAAEAWGLATLVVPLLASWRLRPAFRRQLEGSTKRRHFWFQRPMVGDIPLRWKEHYAGELAAVPFLKRCPRWLLVACVTTLTLAVPGGILMVASESSLSELGTSILALDIPVLRRTLTGAPDEFFLVQGIVVALLFGVAVAVRSAGAVSGERERRSWDLLLLTPLETKQIVRGKLWGIIDSCRPYLLAYLLPALGLAALAGFLPLFWILFCWAWAWVLMYFMGTVGIDNSIRAPSTWRSLLATLAANIWTLVLGYLTFGIAMGAIIMFLLASCMLIPCGVFSGLGWPSAFTAIAIIISCVVIAGLLFAKSEELLEKAEKYLAENERIPHMGNYYIPPLMGEVAVPKTNQQSEHD
jgi:ABC-type transport system involved in multi-copper enzyme maturation permease subunit